MQADVTKQAKGPVLAMLNFDVVGAARAPLMIEGTSSLVQKVIAAAKVAGVSVPERSEDVPSDHRSFIRGGLPAVILTTPDFSVIHTPEDTVDKLSKKPLAESVAVGLAFLDELSKSSTQ